MAGFPQVRERSKVEREFLRLSDKDGQKWPDEANEPGDMFPALFQRRPGARPARPAHSFDSPLGVRAGVRARHGF
jgi:hypothetical protein